MALALRGQAATRDVPDALDCADGCAAEFLHNDHGEVELSPIRQGQVNPAPTPRISALGIGGAAIGNARQTSPAPPEWSSEPRGRQAVTGSTARDAVRVLVRETPSRKPATIQNRAAVGKPGPGRNRRGQDDERRRLVSPHGTIFRKRSRLTGRTAVATISVWPSTTNFARCSMHLTGRG